jgi:hypothetical protein
MFLSSSQSKTEERFEIASVRFLSPAGASFRPIRLNQAAGNHDAGKDIDAGRGEGTRNHKRPEEDGDRHGICVRVIRHLDGKRLTTPDTIVELREPR